MSIYVFTERKTDQVNIKMLKGICDRVRIVAVETSAAATLSLTSTSKIELDLNKQYTTKSIYEIRIHLLTPMSTVS